MYIFLHAGASATSPSSTSKRDGSTADSVSSPATKKRRYDSTAKMQTQQDIDLRSIDDAFIKLQEDTTKSLTDQETKPGELVRYLKKFKHQKAAVNLEDGENKVKVSLPSYLKDFEKDDTIEDVFTRIDRFMSFLDYHILAKIIDKYGKEEDKENLKKYREKLKVFLENWQMDPLVVNESMEDQIKLKFKLDTDSMHMYYEIEGAIADLLGMNVDDIVLVSIDSGCVELVFALPMTAVERLPSLTLSQIAEVAEWMPTI